MLKSDSTATSTVPASVPGDAPLYTLTTRLFHMALALAIIVQLASSFLMVPPMDGDANLAFKIHEYSGLTALVLAAGFWLVVARRRCGTVPDLLWPWFTAERRAAVIADLKAHWQAARALSIPDENGESPLASAVHGLGLALMTGMAATGALFYVAILSGTMESGWAAADLQVHKQLSTLVWAYLIGHAGMALLHHLLRRRSLRVMWRLDAAEAAPQELTKM